MECTNLKNIILELQNAATQVDEEQVEKFADAIIAAKNIFVAGAGRSGFAARGFAIGSGSGTTAGLVVMAEKAKKQGADIATVTINPENTIGSMAKVYIKLPGTTRLLGDNQDKEGSIQPVGSMFEQLSWLTYDSVIMTLKEKTGQSNDDLIARHGNLE